MKRGSTLFLKLVILLIAFVAVVIMIKFPQTEGRAANLDLISIYSDPLIIYMYLATIPFFVALYQAITLLGLVEKNKIFSENAVKAVRNVKLCAVTIACFLIGGMVWVRLAVGGNDDPAGAMAIGIILTFASVVIATASALFQKILQNAVNIKSENDLTV